MAATPQDAYREERVLAASPLELVAILYSAAQAAVRRARQHLALTEVAARSRAITQAYDILAELAGSLDPLRGGGISAGLAPLYDYMQRRLLAANFEQTDTPLEEVLTLLITLGEAWQQIVARPHVPAGNPAVHAAATDAGLIPRPSA
jgi:flagellar protein FliS